METPKSTFRLHKATLRLADKLLESPTKGLLDPVQGAPRNRTELIERLIEKEARELDKRAE